MIYTLPIILGITSLWHGGTGPKAAKAVKNLAWGVCIGGATWFLLYGSLGHGWLAITLSLMAGLISLAGKATGHGRGLGLHEPIKGNPEVLEVLISWAIQHIPTYWYKVIVLSISGFLACGGAFLALLCIQPWAAIPIAIGGLLKGPGYMFGQWLEDRKALLRIYKTFKTRIYSNQIGEFLAGFFAGLGLVFAYLLM
jgi:hypothetical protein